MTLASWRTPAPLFAWPTASWTLAAPLLPAMICRRAVLEPRHEGVSRHFLGRRSDRVSQSILQPLQDADRRWHHRFRRLLGGAWHVSARQRGSLDEPQHHRQRRG